MLPNLDSARYVLFKPGDDCKAGIQPDKAGALRKRLVDLL